MTNKIPWKPERTHYQTFLEKNEGKEVQVNTPQREAPVTPANEPETGSVWEQRAVWILVGIAVSIGVLWLASGSSDDGRRYPEDYDQCDGSRNSYCP